MKKSLKVTVLATAIAALLPTWANAAGLGGINVFSALGQPLRAEIELHAAPEELEGMTAAVPPPALFQQANVAYSPLMTDLDLAIERRGNRSVVRVTSKRVINEPFMDLLVELSWASGRLMREYTFLLDPVEMRPAPAAASAPAASRSAAQPRTAEQRGGSGQVHVVRRGETLHRIASEYMPPGAQIEQMLIALLRENEHAFAGGNINRMQAGARLNIPDEAAIGAVAPLDARDEIRMHAEEFEAYRKRLAGAVSTRPPTPERTPTRESQGVVQPRAEEVVRAERPVDRVQVSGAPPTPGAAAGEASVAADSAYEEEVLVLRRENAELKRRMEALEQQTADTQRALIELSKSALSRPGEALDSSTAAESSASAPPVAATEAPAAATPAPKAEAPKTETPVRRAPPPATAPEPEGLFSNPLLLAAGAAALALLALFGIRIARRRREEDAFAAVPHYASEPRGDSLSVASQPGGESVDTDSGSSVMDADFSQTGLSAIDADEGVDPVAEADVYLAYGRDAQAEEILLDALKVDASRHAVYLKLLEVYVQRGDRRQFEVIATDLYSRTGGQGPDWQRASSMGRKIDPDNPLYGAAEAPAASGAWNNAKVGSAASAAAAAVAAASASVPAAEDEPATELEDTHLGVSLEDAPLPDIEAADAVVADVAEVEESLDADLNALDFELGEPIAQPDTAAVAPVEAAMEDLAFDLDLDGDTAKDAAAVEPPPIEEAAPELAASEPAMADEEPTFMDLERTEFDANLLDFDLDLAPPSPGKADEPANMELSSIDLDLDLDKQAGDSPAAEAPAPRADSAEAETMPQFAAEDVQREMDTKLELARAYDEMGDREGARELLEEVLKDGSPEQREAAERMLERLA